MQPSSASSTSAVFYLLDRINRNDKAPRNTLSKANKLTPANDPAFISEPQAVFKIRHIKVVGDYAYAIEFKD